MHTTRNYTVNHKGILTLLSVIMYVFWSLLTSARKSAFTWQTIAAHCIVCCPGKKHPECLDTILLCKGNKEWHRSKAERKAKSSKNGQP